MSERPATLRRSDNLTAFTHLGAIFLYHDLFGYILEMSEDILGFLDAFAGGADTAEVCARYAGAFDDQTPESFVDIFSQFSCLVEPDDDDIDHIWGTVPVKGKWNVWRREEDGSLTFFTAWGDHPLAKHSLSPAEVSVWELFDGETPLSVELRQAHPEVDVPALIKRLAHHGVQALKLSAVPVSFYKGRLDRRPPYLNSTMPYVIYEPGTVAAPPTTDGEMSTRDYYSETVADADDQFDVQETTLSHLLRRPHPLLGGRTYGAALVDALAERAMLPSAEIRILEVGGGLGFLARAVVEALQARGLTVRHEIVELSPVLAAAQRERCAGLPVEVREGDIMSIELGEGSYDLFIANEMIGDLHAARLSHQQVGIGLDDAGERQRRLVALGATGALIAELGLNLEDAPNPFYFTAGAFELVRRAATLLCPGGAGVITEFGEQMRYPRLATHMDHPELSIHFGHLESVAKYYGLTTEFQFVIDLLGFDRTIEGMASTRSYFRALKALLAEHGVELDKVGYTRETFAELIEGKLEKDRFGEMRYDRVEDRLMGLVPHEFKALLVKRPGD